MYRSYFFTSEGMVVGQLLSDSYAAYNYAVDKSRNGLCTIITKIDEMTSTYSIYESGECVANNVKLEEMKVIAKNVISYKAQFNRGNDAEAAL